MARPTTRKIGKHITKLDVRHLDIQTLAKDFGKVVLVLASIGAILPLVAIAPALPGALAELSDLFQKTPRRKRNRVLRHLEKQHLIEIHEEKDGHASITLTVEGKRRVLRFNFEHLRLEEPERWDNTWRIFAFDIPEEHSRSRRALRIKIQQLGLYRFQKSVFVYPYPCRDEIDFVANFFGVGKYINYIEAGFIDDAPYLKQHFQLT